MWQFWKLNGLMMSSFWTMQKQCMKFSQIKADSWEHPFSWSMKKEPWQLSRKWADNWCWWMWLSTKVSNMYEFMTNDLFGFNNTAKQQTTPLLRWESEFLVISFAHEFNSVSHAKQKFVPWCIMVRYLQPNFLHTWPTLIPIWTWSKTKIDDWVIIL